MERYRKQTIRLSFNPEDKRYNSPIEAAENWLETMDHKLETMQIPPDQKVGICLANLRYSPNYETPKHGQFNSFDEFKEWFRQCILRRASEIRFLNKLHTTFQLGTFREYYLLFKKIREENQQLDFFLGEQDMNAIFLQNLRNIHLRKLLQQSNTKHFSDLIRLGEQLIKSGMVKERTPVHDDRSLDDETSSPNLDKNFDARDHLRDSKEPRDLMDTRLEPRGPANHRLEPKDDPRDDPRDDIREETRQITQGEPTSDSEAAVESADQSPIPENFISNHIDPPRSTEEFPTGPPSYSPDLRDTEATHAAAVDAAEAEAKADAQAAAEAAAEAATEAAQAAAEVFHNSYETSPAHESHAVFEPLPPPPVHEQEFYDTRPSYERDQHTYMEQDVYEDFNSPPPSEDATVGRFLTRSERYEEPRAIEDGWKYRFTLGDTECPLDTSFKDKMSLEDSAKSWLGLIEERLNKLEFKSQEEQVSFCLHNLGGFVRKAANLQPPFKSYPRFRNWFCQFFDLMYEKRDVVNDLIDTKQTGTIDQYKLTFQNIHDENEFCKYPVSPQLIMEFFIKNLADRRLKAKIYEGRYFGLFEVFSQLDIITNSGEFSGSELSASTPKSTNPVPSNGSTTGASTSTGFKPSHARKHSSSDKKLQPKRARDVSAQHRQARTGIVKPSGAESPVITRPPVAEPPAAMISTHPSRRVSRPLEERIQIARSSPRASPRPPPRPLPRSRNNSDELFGDRMETKKVHFGGSSEHHYAN
ncbi:hypothetical protein JCM33374_g1778 [Metschnikowia sp. JCM 33374]|nr:hypothetical protein JCM33374_g1778 [Metschnikowia sp. JCM 33374]